MNKFSIQFLVGLALSFFIPHSANAQWVRTAGPEGGYISALSSSSDTLLAGSYMGWVYRSIDQGASWTAIERIPSNYLVSCLLTNNGVIYAGTVGGGVFRSPDNGSHWIMCDSAMTGSTIEGFTACNGTVFARVSGSIFLSTNNGVNWSEGQLTAPKENIRAIAAHGAALLAYGGWCNFVQSIDCGANWKTFPDTIYSNIKLLTFKGDTAFAYDYSWGVLLSPDIGRTWVRVSARFSNKPVSSLEPLGNDLFLGTGDSGVFRSTNNGSTWSALNTGLDWPHVGCLTTCNGRLFAGTEGGGIFQLNEAHTRWTAVNSGLTALQVQALAGNGGMIFAGSGFFTGLYCTANRGLNWTVPDNPLKAERINAFSQYGQSMYAATGGQGVWLSMDNGSTWARNGLKDTAVTALAVSDATLLAGTLQFGLYLSIDGGSHWTKRIADQFITAVAIHDNTFFAGTNGHGAFRSTDYGENWVPTGSETIDPNIQAFTVFNGTVFAGTAYGIFLSTNDGAQWIEADSGLVNRNVCAFTGIGNTVFTATSGGGVFYSNDNGVQWHDFNDGLIDSSIQCLMINGADIYAGAFSSGVWRRPLSDAGIAALKPINKSRGNYDIALFVSRNRLVVSYFLDRGGSVIARMYDPAGHEITSYRNDISGRGNHDLIWDTRHIASGCYRVIFHGGGKTFSKNVVIFR
jgi:photosystem II stability/assembly factor-like uncharacterized protein